MFTHKPIRIGGIRLVFTILGIWVGDGTTHGFGVAGAGTVGLGAVAGDLAGAILGDGTAVGVGVPAGVVLGDGMEAGAGTAVGVAGVGTAAGTAVGTTQQDITQIIVREQTDLMAEIMQLQCQEMHQIEMQ